MTTDQALLFALYGCVLGLLLWGRVRYDLVAASGLFVAVLLGLVPEHDAFAGFANPAVVIVALVLVASRAVENSGALGWLTKIAANEKRPVPVHIALFGGIAAALSAVINNVAALAMLMPIDVAAARKAKRPPGITLMPLAAATILGGMATLIGTPINIIASSIRQKALGAPYSMFDFTPVGASVALVGLIFVALVGWRFVPRRADATGALDASSFEAELQVPPASALEGKLCADLDAEAEKADVLIVGMVRDDRRRRRSPRAMLIRPGDLLVVEGSTDAIADFIKTTGLEMALAPTKEDTAAPPEEEDEKDKKPAAPVPQVIEAVVRSDSLLSGRSAARVGLRRRFGITLLGINRAGSMSRAQVRDRIIAPGDELLLTGRFADQQGVLEELGLVAVNQVSIAPFDLKRAALAVGIFAAAIVAATSGFLYFTVAIAIAVAAYGAVGLVPAREFYTHIDWPVIVMLACLLPLGGAFESVGGTQLLASAIAHLTQGYPPVVALMALMVVTLALSDMLNNVATMVITGPVAVSLAKTLSVNPDTFLMGVAIAASSALLTPIGHKNNTLVMGPGGFRFSDYWPMGLPLELVVLAVSVPMLLLVWPL